MLMKEQKMSDYLIGNINGWAVRSVTVEKDDVLVECDCRTCKVTYQRSTKTQGFEANQCQSCAAKNRHLDC